MKILKKNGKEKFIKKEKEGYVSKWMRENWKRLKFDRVRKVFRNNEGFFNEKKSNWKRREERRDKIRKWREENRNE